MGWVINNLIEDIAQFLGISVIEMKERINVEYHHQFKYKGKVSRDTWTENTWYYFYELIAWNLDIVNCFVGCIGKDKAMCDFGAGIGTEGLLWALSGCDVTMIEINNKQRDFINYRIKKHKVKAIAKRKLDVNDINKFDYILLRDVIGHLTTPVETFAMIVACLKKKGILDIRGWGNICYSSEGKMRLNKEIDFHELVLKLGLVEDGGKAGERMYVKN